MNQGIIGNCAYSALVHEGEVTWLCWPRMDSSFLFGSLLDSERGGTFRVQGVDAKRVTQRYETNTNILVTTFECADGVFELVDFAPRFHHFERYYKPTMLMRMLRRVSGHPRVKVCCRPVGDYGRIAAQSETGSNHIEFTGLASRCRLTTDVSLAYIQEERPFVLDEDRHLALTWGQPLEAPLVETTRTFLRRTRGYWRTWVRHMRVPRDYQEEVIRSALVLKLHQFEDTGAIIAATTTSLPEYPGSGRNWDYRYCWLRDAYFSLDAFELLGHSEEMRSFLGWLRNVVANDLAEGEHRIQPLYGVGGEARLVEQILEHLDGFQGEKPVRIGNQAYEHIQNDVYGEMILAISRLLLDTRFIGEAGIDGAEELLDILLGQIERRLEGAGRRALGVAQHAAAARLHAADALGWRGASLRDWQRAG